MGCRLDDYTIDAMYTAEELKKNPDLLRGIAQTGMHVKHKAGYKGKDQIVAVVDTGVSPHPALGNRLLKGKNFIKKYGNDSYYDDNGHGTHVATTIAGYDPVNELLCGVAPEAEILPCKVLGATGGGEWSDMIDALYWIIAYRHPKTGNKVKVINMSLSGGESDISATEKANLEKALEACVAADILPVVSMGNTSDTRVRYPAAFSCVCAVGAVDRKRNIAMFSTRGNHADLCQDGVDVIAAYYQGDYVAMSGTSMSTPKVSGMAAVLGSEYQAREKKPIPEYKLYEGLKIYSVDLGIPGTDKEFGAGYCTFQLLNLVLKVEHGSDIAYVNGKPVKMKRPVEMLDGYTTMTVRDLIEILGGDISWIPQTGEHNTQAEFRL